MRSPGHLEPDGGNDERSGTFVIDCVLPVAVNITPGDPTNVVSQGAAFDVAILTTKAGEYKLPLDVDHTMLDASSILFGPAQPPGPGFGGSSPAATWLDDSFELDDVTRDGDTDTLAQFVAPGGEPHGGDMCLQGRVITKDERPVWFYGCDHLSVGQPPK